MPWLKVDDQLHDHRKARAAGKAAMGVWVLAASWAVGNLSDGFVPESVVRRWGTPADAKRLVAAGLWHPVTVEGERGWRFHDWSDYQPSAAEHIAKREAWRAAKRQQRNKSRRSPRSGRFAAVEPDPIGETEPN